MSPRRLAIVGARVDAGAREEMDREILELSRAGGCRRVLFANVHMVVESWRNAELASAMARADLVCPDGMPLVWLVRRWFPGQPRVEGMAAFPRLMELAHRRGIRVGWIGSTPQVQEAMRAKAASEFPGLAVVLSEAPSFGGIDEAEHRELQDRIRRSGVELLFVGLGCPRQEIWMSRVGGVDACLLGVGNAFEIWLGRRRRAPVWARRWGLEWAFRLAQEPRRLARRYLRSNLLFVLALPGWILGHREISTWGKP